MLVIRHTFTVYSTILRLIAKNHVFQIWLIRNSSIVATAFNQVCMQKLAIPLDSPCKVTPSCLFLAHTSDTARRKAKKTKIGVSKIGVKNIQTRFSTPRKPQAGGDVIYRAVPKDLLYQTLGTVWPYIAGVFFPSPKVDTSGGGFFMRTARVLELEAT